MNGAITRGALGDALIAHTRLTDYGLCSCGQKVPLGRRFPDHQADALLDLLAADRAPVVTLCGSTKFKDAINAENSRLTQEGNVVVSLGLFGHTDLPDYDWSTDATDLKTMLDRLHFQKIDMADRVHVVNVDGYIGESTRREIDYAISQGKPITFLVGRPFTPPIATAAGSTRLRVHRMCDGCGRDLGDANEAELEAAVEGRPMPSVTNECGCYAAPQPPIVDVRLGSGHA